MGKRCVYVRVCVCARVSLWNKDLFSSPGISNWLLISYLSTVFPVCSPVTAVAHKHCCRNGYTFHKHAGIHNCFFHVRAHACKKRLRSRCEYTCTHVRLYKWFKFSLSVQISTLFQISTHIIKMCQNTKLDPFVVEPKLQNITSVIRGTITHTHIWEAGTSVFAWWMSNVINPLSQLIYFLLIN